MTVSEIMSGDTHLCTEGEDVHQVARSKGENLIRRLPVLGHEGRLVGVVPLGNIAQADDSDASVALPRSVTGVH